MATGSDKTRPPDAARSGASGALDGGEFLDLVYTVCKHSEEGVIEVCSEVGTGKIAVRSGRVCHAQISDLQGEAAFSKIATAASGSFQLRPSEREDRTSITKPLEDLIVDTLQGQEKTRQEECSAETLEPATESLFQMVQKMTITQKLRFAMRCDKEGRTLLLREPNRAVQLAIIANPRITEGEVTVIAWFRGADEEVLRRIAENREWVRHYPVRLGLAWNPKTSLSIVTKLLPTLMPEDLSKIAKSKDVPIVVAHAARKLILRKC
jgi:hypothetical protein